MIGLDETLFAHFELPVFLAAFSICGFLIFFGKRHPRLSGRVSDLGATQAMHHELTPRVGGLGVLAAILAASVYLPLTLSAELAIFALAAVLLFGAGLLEDLGYHVSPRGRLLAVMIASVIVIAGIGIWIPRADLPLLDLLIGQWYIGIPLTIVVVAALSNGFNLIDGVNGLAAFTSIVAALAMAAIANEVGASTASVAGVLLAASILGFFALNYPFGLIFLGDAGAYTIGFALSWFGIFLINFSPDVSPWAILLTVFWPAADTIYAIYRRTSRNRSMMHPDRLHPHQVVLRCLEVCLLGRNRRNLANPMTTAALAPFVAAPPLVAVLVWDRPVLALVSFLLFGVVFVTSLAVLTRLAQGRSFARVRSAVAETLPARTGLARRVRSAVATADRRVAGEAAVAVDRVHEPAE